jgi:hypothetical protein
MKNTSIVALCSFLFTMTACGPDNSQTLEPTTEIVEEETEQSQQELGRQLLFCAPAATQVAISCGGGARCLVRETLAGNFGPGVTIKCVGENIAAAPACFNAASGLASCVRNVLSTKAVPNSCKASSRGVKCVPK